MTIEFSKELKSAINKVSQIVCEDIEDEFAYNASLVAELTIDAGRLSMYASEAADKELQNHIKVHGYSAVFKESQKFVCTL